MAQHGQQPKKKSWAKFFLGSPLRFLLTFGSIVFFAAAVFPDLTQRALQNFVYAVGPSVSQLFAIAIALLGIWVICTKALFPKKKKKGSDH